MSRAERNVFGHAAAGCCSRELVSRVWSRQPARLVVVRPRRADLELLSRFIEEGALTPIVDRVLPWTEAAEAHAYLETKHARGEVVPTLD